MYKVQKDTTPTRWVRQYIDNILKLVNTYNMDEYNASYVHLLEDLWVAINKQFQLMPPAQLVMGFTGEGGYIWVTDSETGKRILCITVVSREELFKSLPDPTTVKVEDMPVTILYRKHMHKTRRLTPFDEISYDCFRFLLGRDALYKANIVMFIDDDLKTKILKNRFGNPT